MALINYPLKRATIRTMQKRPPLKTKASKRRILFRNPASPLFQLSSRSSSRELELVQAVDKQAVVVQLPVAVVVEEARRKFELQAAR